MTIDVDYEKNQGLTLYEALLKLGVAGSETSTAAAEVVYAALRFKEKVERDAPSCFVPSRELKVLFDLLEKYHDK